MRCAHLVCDQGVSGDLLLGALLDAGAALEEVRESVAHLGLSGVEIRADRESTAGVTATRAQVVTTGATPRLERWSAIVDRLDRAELDAPVAKRVMTVMRRLAEAEATVHGHDLDEVRLHELGDADTLVDVVAVCSALEGSSIDRLTCGPVAVGGGEVVSDHGALPVPPPAVVELLEGFEIHGGSAYRELATPTGAALIATLARPVPSIPPMRLEGHGRGVVGTAPRTSILTVLFGRSSDRTEPDGVPDADQDDATFSPATVVEATIDDLSPELVPVVLDALRHAGADDAWATPVLMKKGRPGYTLTALCGWSVTEAVCETLLLESTTIGLRTHAVTKQALARRTVSMEVMGHDVRMKLSTLGDEVIRAKPELDDVRAVAARLGRPVREVLAAAEEVARRQHGTARGD